MAGDCEKCGGRGEVLETREARDTVRRRRRCERCGTRWTTYERRAGEDAVYAAAMQLAKAAFDSVGPTEDSPT